MTRDDRHRMTSGKSLRNVLKSLEQIAWQHDLIASWAYELGSARIRLKHCEHSCEVGFLSWNYGSVKFNDAHWLTFPVVDSTPKLQQFERNASSPNSSDRPACGHCDHRTKRTKRTKAQKLSCSRNLRVMSPTAASYSSAKYAVACGFRGRAYHSGRRRPPGPGPGRVLASHSR